MKLYKIYFDSFKSLINETLKLNDNCIGIVGINESGKTNILHAIRVLNSDEELTLKCQPKIDKSLNPKLRFCFDLDKKVKSQVNKSLYDWINLNSLVNADEVHFDFKVQYTIEYDIKSEVEKRTFEIIDLNPSKSNLLVIKEDFIDNKHFLLRNEDAIPLTDAMIITKDILDSISNDSSALKEKLVGIIDKVTKLDEKILELNETISANPETAEKNNPILEELKQQKNNSESEIKEIEDIIQKIEIRDKIENLESNLKELNAKVDSQRNSLNQSNKIIHEYTIKPNLNPHEKGVLTKSKNSKKENEIKIDELKNEISATEHELKKLNTPLKDKYTKDFTILTNYVSKIIAEVLEENLPKVIFWEYSDEYILKSETLFKELESKTSLVDISRPLLNLFRVGLGIDSIQELKSKIDIIKSDPSERGRIEDTFNRKINEYIKGVWEDYDQKLKIFVEEHKIRIQFYDPETESASYYNMDERSQGAQTFISFLMTIGAEAESQVINNMILILDEPEIHLHPSGVRYMLNELIKISKLNNIVIYATHSIFMIDRKKYDRHVFLKKSKERTSINPSRKDRVGYFMQEEVLYKAIDIDLTKDFKTTNVFNFVFGF